jgi:hypothetical protein
LLESPSSSIVEKNLSLVKDYLTMKVNCGQYSKSMELLALKRNLEAGIADEEERERTKERIQVLEKELELD